VGEWLGLPLATLAGSVRTGDVAFEEVFHPLQSGSWNGVMPCCASAVHRRGRIGWSGWRGLGFGGLSRFTGVPGAKPPRIELCAA